MVKTNNHLNPIHHGNLLVLGYIKTTLFTLRKYINKISIKQFIYSIIQRKNYFISSSI